MVQCKCHGVSGSCNIKTCWKAMPPMPKIGEKLLRRFTNAKEVQKNVVNEITKLPEAVKGSSASDQLLYLVKSPDYCTKDVRLGSVGTSERFVLFEIFE